jgi:hypothetical protein
MPLNKRELRLKIILDDMWETHGYVATAVADEVAFNGERYVEDKQVEISMSLEPVEEFFKVLKVREFRREMLIAEATKLGHALADHLEDAEGWHGLERQEKTLEARKRHK